MLVANHPHSDVVTKLSDLRVHISGVSLFPTWLAHPDAAFHQDSKSGLASHQGIISPSDCRNMML